MPINSMRTALKASETVISSVGGIASPPPLDSSSSPPVAELSSKQPSLAGAGIWMRPRRPIDRRHPSSHVQCWTQYISASTARSLRTFVQLERRSMPVRMPTWFKPQILDEASARKTSTMMSAALVMTGDRWARR